MEGYNDLSCSILKKNIIMFFYEYEVSSYRTLRSGVLYSAAGAQDNYEDELKLYIEQ